jgi:hypothetical protein
MRAAIKKFLKKRRLGFELCVHDVFSAYITINTASPFQACLLI